MRAGGAGLYAARALDRLGARVILHTPLAARDRDLLGALPARVRVVEHPSRETTRFRLEFDRARPNERRLFAVSASDPVDADRIGAQALSEAAWVLLGPLLPRDLPASLLAALTQCGRPLHLGIQGLVRAADPGAVVVPAAYPLVAQLPPLAVLCGDESEVDALAGSPGAPPLAEIASEIVVTRGDHGARIAAGAGQPVEVAAVPPRRLGGEPVGLGDTFLAVYSWWRRAGRSIEESGREAATAATALLEGSAER